MELTFNFKKTKEVEVEKYPESSVLTFIGDNGYAKFKMNKKACELLEYDEGSVTARISFARNKANDDLVLLNTTGTETDNQSNVFVSKDFASKKLLNRIEKSFDIKLTTGYELLLKAPESSVAFPAVIITDELNSGNFTTDSFENFPDNADQVTDQVADQEEILKLEKTSENFGNPSFV